MNPRKIAAIAVALATAGAVAAPATGVAAAPTKTVAYTVKVHPTVVVAGASHVRATAVVTNPQQDVKDWWSRSTVSSVVRYGINNGFEEPYGRQGYRCVPSVDTSSRKVTVARFTCRLQGADVPTTIKLTFTARYNPPTGP